jgi:hypothetical protein
MRVETQHISNKEHKQSTRNDGAYIERLIFFVDVALCFIHVLDFTALEMQIRPQLSAGGNKLDF